MRLTASTAVFAAAGAGDLPVMARNVAPDQDAKRMVADRIRALRRERKVTQQWLADRAELSVDAVSALERGLALPNFETLFKLARAFELPMGDFFGHEEGGAGSERAVLFTRLVAHARLLSDEDLSVAVDQIAVLAHRPRVLRSNAKAVTGPTARRIRG